MSNYQPVKDALAQGISPEAICATCPWDRFCMDPPSMSAQDVERQIEEARRKDDEAAQQAKAEGKEAGMPIGMLVMTLAVAGRDTTASLCPALAAVMPTSLGQEVVTGVKAVMQRNATVQ